MILLLESFDAYATAQIPAVNTWDSGSHVTISTDAGRSGFSGDNAAFFDTSVNPILTKTLTPGTASGVYIATYGLALQVLTCASTATLASILTGSSRFSLQMTPLGVLRVTETLGTLLLGTVCETVAGAIPIGSGGCYVEVRIVFQLGLASAVQIRVSDQFGEMNPLVQGALLGADVGPYTTFQLAGIPDEEPATWLIDDIYFTDGVPTTLPLAYKGRLIYNDGYLGNTHVQALYPTADGANLTTGNTPWVPTGGSHQFDCIDEHPPDEDVTFLAADTSQQTTSCAYALPQVSPFGRIGCSAVAPIYGLQWDGRLRISTDPVSVAPIVRKIVTGILASDVVWALPVQTIDSDSYQYYQVVYDRNPVDGNAPWSFAAFIFSAVGGVGNIEFGARLL